MHSFDVDSFCLVYGPAPGAFSCFKKYYVRTGVAVLNIWHGWLRTSGASKYRVPSSHDERPLPRTSISPLSANPLHCLCLYLLPALQVDEEIAHGRSWGSSERGENFYI